MANDLNQKVQVFHGLRAMTSIRSKFFITNFFYAITCTLLCSGLTVFFTTIGTVRLCHQRQDNQVLMTSIRLADELGKEAPDIDRLNVILRENMQAVDGSHYARLFDESNHEIISWYSNAKAHINTVNVPLDGDYVIDQQYFTTKHSFKVNNQQYYLQMGIYLFDMITVTTTLYAIGITTLFLCLLMAALIVWKVMKNNLVKPVENVSRKYKEIFDNADLTITIPVETNDEIGQLSKIINDNNQKQRQLLHDIKACCNKFNAINAALSTAGQNINQSATDILQHTTNSTNMMNNLLHSFQEVSSQLNELSKHSERSSTTVYEMAQINQEVSDNVGIMSSSVQDSIIAIGQINGSIQQNTAHIDHVTTEINAVNNSVQRLEESIANEAIRAKDTLSLSRQFSIDAASGMSSLDQTISGIDQIQSTSKQVYDIITELAGRAKDIGTILQVIEDVNNQTNLLALNAAIIAAQAGEQGRGFAVVADEIGGLASRTKNSTKEIAALITNIQQSSNEAMSAIQADQQAIDNGIALGRQAAQAFATLKESAENSARQSQEIADATILQANEVRAVTTAISNITEAIKQVNSSSHSQSEEASAMNHAAKKMENISTQVANSSTEQARSSQEVLNAISNINSMSAMVNQKQKEQTTGAEQAVQLVDIIDKKAEQQQVAVHKLEQIISEINTQINTLSLHLGACKF